MQQWKSKELPRGKTRLPRPGKELKRHGRVLAYSPSDQGQIVVRNGVVNSNNRRADRGRIDGHASHTVCPAPPGPDSVHYKLADFGVRLADPPSRFFSRSTPLSSNTSASFSTASRFQAAICVGCSSCLVAARNRLVALDRF